LEDNFTILLGRNILLKITENVKARALLEDPLVQKIVSTANLCNEKLSKAIEELLRLDPSGGSHNMKNFLSTYRIFFDHDAKELAKTITSVDVQMSDLAQKTDSETQAERFGELWSSISSEKGASSWEKKERALLAADEQVRSISGLDLLEPTVAALCPTCKTTLQVGEFKGTVRCIECKREIGRKEIERVPIHRIAEPVKRLWAKDFWFEAYLARLFEKLGWTTWTAVHIMGSSGVPHEIDVLARKDSNVVVVECKTGDVARNHVFTFLTKVQDLKVNLGILALMGPLPEPETRSFAKRSRLLVTVENMSKTDEKEILETLKKELPS